MSEKEPERGSPDFFRRRLDRVKKWAEDNRNGAGHLLRRMINFEQDELDAYQADQESCPEEFDLVEYRYLVVKITYYSQQTETVDAESCADLKDAATAVEDHVFQDANPDYYYNAKVLDLDGEVVNLPWYEKCYVEWGECPEGG
jgi:hypothetical protein